MAKTGPVSPLAPARFPDLPVIEGVRFAAAAAGVRYEGRTDVMLAHLIAGTTVAGVFTKSSTRSAAVRDCWDKLGETDMGPAAFIVNSGNSNAFTGKAGDASVKAICEGAATALGIDESRVFTSSTGVIGEPMPHEKIVGQMDTLYEALDEGGIEGAAQAIMTTDTFPKGAAAEVKIGGKTVKIAGIAKGSGMIAPDMATMLVYIFTDAEIGYRDLQGMLAHLTDRTFNCITVDSDTSTSDTLLMAATGASGVDVSGHTGFANAMEAVMLNLAHQVVRDGEGATKFIEVRVTGAQTDADAHKVALAIANSPLVKTAVAGEDPNWGRIVMAVGKSGAEADRDLLTIRFGEILVAVDGFRSPKYSEEEAAEYMKGSEIVIDVDLGFADETGGGIATVWTCDLTARYIEINADYRS